MSSSSSEEEEEEDDNGPYDVEASPGPGSIAAALESCPRGGKILLRPGVYKEQVTARMRPVSRRCHPLRLTSPRLLFLAPFCSFRFFCFLLPSSLALRRS